VSTSSSGRQRGFRPGSQGCGCGCASVLVVLTVGLLLSLFNSAIAIGVTVRVPFTDSNLTLAGSVGKKEKAVESLPNYTAGRLAGNQNLINSTATLTIGPAEGTTLLLLGRQPGAPALDLHLAAH
jgi:hypothetical protein